MSILAVMSLLIFPPDPAYLDATTLGPGPHTLVISEGLKVTRIDYETGPACQKARDEVLKKSERSASRVKAICVAR